MEIRPATVADVPAVLPMVAKIAALHQSWDQSRYDFLPDIQRLYDTWLKHRATDPNSVFLVAEREAAGTDPALLVGFLVGEIEREIPIYHLQQFGWLHDLWIEEPYRNEGLARQLVTLAIERFASLGVRQIRLETASQNNIARKLFESCGFRPSTVEMLLEIGGNP